ncbi:carbohydrate ABC transporter permease [Sinomonas atrocyanea]
MSTDLKPQTRAVPGPAFRVPRPGRSKVFRGLGLVLLTVIAATFVLPILWSVSTSLRIPAESYDNPPQWIPLNPVWSNYAAVFEQVPLATFFLNSVLVTGAIVVLQLITSTMSGYAFALVRFRGKGAVFAMVLATMMVPAQTTIIPIFILIRYLGLSDNLWSLVVPAFGVPSARSSCASTSSRCLASSPRQPASTEPRTSRSSRASMPPSRCRRWQPLRC